MIKKIIYLILLIFLSETLSAQIVFKKRLPRSFEKNISADFSKYTYNLPKLNIQKYIDEDNLTNEKGGERFAAPYEVNLSIDKDGKWTTLPNGDKIWQLKINSKGAFNLNFQFNEFVLPLEGEFYIYSANKKDIRGAFTSENNRKDKSFAVYLVKGESAILEYYQPKSTISNPKINIERISHGYKASQGFGNSGSCNNNINCPIGSDWQDEKKSVALIVTGGINGAVWCSGAMVNNVRQDGTPYFLTAEHCLTGVENNWAVIYNFESPNCSDIDASYSESVLGATVLANHSPSDFALLLLDEAPPVSYDVYHSGWNADNVVKDSVVCIHHPRGDIKKISFDFDSIIDKSYVTTDFDHWEALDWNSGTTEPTSSGAPLYDKFHRIIGQLHAGSAECGNDLEDVFGKFSYSWDNGNSPQTRLKDWLDPDNTGLTVLDGNNFNIPQFTLDAALTSVDMTDQCDTMLANFDIYYKNLGSDTITNLEVKVILDSINIQTSSWLVNLPFSDANSFTINGFSVAEGLHELTIILSNPNDTIDDNNLNDTITKIFNATNGNSITLDLNTDNFGFEIGLEISDINNNIVYSRLGFKDNSSIKIDNCLQNGCYTIKVTDDFGDGIENKEIYIINETTPFDVISGDFTTETNYYFNIQDGIITKYNDENCTLTSIKNKLNQLINIFPNPNNGIFIVKSNLDIDKIIIYNLVGKQILASNNNKDINTQINLTDYPKGVYFIHILSGEETIIKKLIFN